MTDRDTNGNRAHTAADTFYFVPASPETGRKDLIACGACVNGSTVPMDEIDAVLVFQETDTPVKCAHCKKQGCEHCGFTGGVKDYNQGYSKHPFLLCEDCTEKEADSANERSQGDAWAGGFADNH